MKGLVYAAKLMSGKGNNKVYGWLKRKISETGLTEEHKANIGKSQSGRKQTPEHIEKRRQALLNGIDKKIECIVISKEQLLENFRLKCKKNDLKRQQKKDSVIITALIYAVS